MLDAKVKPIVLEQSGRVRAKIWPRKNKAGKPFFTIDIYRTYRVTDKSKLSGPEDNGFRNTSVFAYEDRDNIRTQLDKAESVIQDLLGQ